MSASKSKATDTHLGSELRARRLFLRIYAMFAVLLVGVVGYFYFTAQEKLMLSKQRIEMMEYATTQARRLKRLHKHYPKDKVYPRDSRFESGIYDLEYKKIFSTLKQDRVRLDKSIYNVGESTQLIKMLDDYYLGAKYLVIEVPENKNWYIRTTTTVSIYSLLILLLVMLAGLYLARLFVAPMRSSILLLDRFIKDTTHELNTPLSAILTNIEMMDRDDISQSNAKKLNRVEIGARTVSTLYDDLKYLTLEQDKEVLDEQFDMFPFVQSRLEYFSLQMEQKRITLHTDLSNSQIKADKRLICRIIDNLLSNAIKYNKRNGEIRVTLMPNMLSIADSGVGIDADSIDDIFDRYSRFDSSEGGFGVGLNIVRKIVDHYGMSIDVDSQVDVGTTMTLRWER